MSFKWIILLTVMVAKRTDAACQNGQLGNPNFHCYNQNASYCAILNDPTVNTFSNEHAKVIVIGTVKVAEFSVETPTELGTDKCSVTLWAETETIAGKIFISGFRARIIREDAGTGFQPSFYEFEVQQNATPAQIEWTAGFRTSILKPFNFRYTFVSNGIPSGDVLRNIGDCDLSYSLTNDGFFILEFPCCNIRVGFRPSIPGQRHVKPPGIWVEVENSNIQFPSWTPGLEPLCLTSGSVNISSIQQNTGTNSGSEALTQLSFTNADNVILSGTSSNFRVLTEILKLCSINSTRLLFAEINSILGSTGLVKCISNGIQEVLVSFLVLIENWICVHSSESCSQAKAILQVNCSSLVSQNPILNAFVNTPC